MKLTKTHVLLPSATSDTYGKTTNEDVMKAIAEVKDEVNLVDIKVMHAQKLFEGNYTWYPGVVYAKLP